MCQIILRPKPTGATLTRWLYNEIRAAILSGRLRRGSRLPASREFAAGTQQSLDLLARLVTAPGDAVWLEDPCYILAFWLRPFRRGRSR
jgi:DNA-binding transcriptional MocR family regulator